MMEIGKKINKMERELKRIRMVKFMMVNMLIIKCKEKENIFLAMAMNTKVIFIMINFMEKEK